MANTPHLFKKMGQVPPREAIEPILKNANQGIWSVRIESGAFRIFQANDPVVLDAFMNSLDQSNLRSSQVAFGFVDKKADKAIDMQPEVVLEDDGDAILLAMWDGEVDMDAFQDIVDEAWKEVGEDLEKLVNVLNGPAKRTLITQKCWKAGDRAQIFLWPIIGEPQLFRSNKTFEEYGWGWVSNAFRPAPDTKTTTSSSVPAVDGRPLTVQEKLLRKAAAKTKLATATTPVATAAAIPADAGTAFPNPEEMVILGPPPDALSNKEKRTWWTVRLGETPSNYKKAVVSVPKSKLRTADAPKSVVIPDTKKAAEAAITTDVNFMVMDPKIIEAIKEDFANMKTMPADEQEKFLKDNPSFSEQTKIPIEKWFSAHPDEKRKIAVKYSAQCASLLIEVLDVYAKALEEIDTLLATPVVATKETPADRIAKKQAAKAAAAGK